MFKRNFMEVRKGLLIKAVYIVIYVKWIVTIDVCGGIVIFNETI